MRRFVTKPGSRQIGMQEARKGKCRGKRHTFRPITHTMQCLSRYLEENRDAAQHEPQRAPEVLDHEVFHDTMIEPSP